MDFFIGMEAMKLMSRQRGASLYELAEELDVSLRYARDVVDTVDLVQSVYERTGDYLYPRRKRYYLHSTDEFGRPLEAHSEKLGGIA